MSGPPTVARVGERGWQTVGWAIAAVVAVLLSSASSYLSGHNLVVDGGSLLGSAQMDPVLSELLGGADR